MSLLVAVGTETSSFHGVSVVPISQYSSHGMMNSTDFSVCVMMPVLSFASIASRGTVMWMPFEAST